MWCIIYFVFEFLKYVWIFFLQDPMSGDKNGTDIKLFNQKETQNDIRIYLSLLLLMLMGNCVALNHQKST